MQYGQRDWARWGGGGNINSYTDARAAAEREFAANAKAHQARFGREMTGDEGYLYHQQGAGGGPALLAANPNALAWQVLRPLYRSDREAQSAISNNVLGNLRSQFPNPLAITAGQFRDMWRDRFQRQIGAPLGVPAPAQPPAETPPLLQVASGAPFPGRMGAGLSDIRDFLNKLPNDPITGRAVGDALLPRKVKRVPESVPPMPPAYSVLNEDLPPISYPPPQPNVPLPYYPDMPPPGTYGDERPDIGPGNLSAELTPPPPAPPPDMAFGEPQPPGPLISGGRAYTPEEQAAMDEAIKAFAGRSVIPGPGLVNEQGAAPAVPGLPQVPVKPVPTTTTAAAQPQAPADNSILARIGLPGVAAWGRAVQQSPAFMGGLGGLMFGAPGFGAGLSAATAGIHAGIAERQEGRSEER